MVQNNTDVKGFDLKTSLVEKEVKSKSLMTSNDPTTKH